MSTIGAFLLIPASEAYVEAGDPASPSLLELGETLVNLDRQMWEIHMVFYGLGALVWYSLMFRTKCVPRWLSAWGVVAVAVGLFSSLVFLGGDIDWFFLGFPTGLFEVVIGIWLLTKGLSPPEDETLFHSPHDTPDQVDPNHLLEIAAALADLITTWADDPLLLSRPEPDE